jgi:hypothetical protein
MRVIAAGLFVFGGLLGFVALGSGSGVFQSGPAWLIGPLFTLGFIGLVAASLWLFNRSALDVLGYQSAEERLLELESAGLLDWTDYGVTRAFGVAESEDEGLHYYLELDDGRVLFLTGQYLYDSEPAGDDAESIRRRRFPCSEFTIRRHIKEGYVADIQCRGTVLEPELIAPPFNQEDWNANRVPDDGEIISKRTYDELKRERTSVAAKF